MPRPLRIQFPGAVYHVMNRGNGRQAVFEGAADAQEVMTLLETIAAPLGWHCYAYCLMTNHVHLVAIPETPRGLHLSLKAVHGQYAQRVNRMRKLKGHLWQGRYFSSPLDSPYFRNAVRYVELNPVRAGLVRRAEDYPWSSAAAHCGLRGDPVVDRRPGSVVFTDVENWSNWLAQGLATDDCDLIRRNCAQNLPCGSPAFIDELERLSGRRLRNAPPGRRQQPDAIPQWISGNVPS